MENLVPHFIELIRRAATDLPADMEVALRRARENEEPSSAAQTTLDAILENVRLSREGSTPICQDTGTPIFYVYYPTGWSTLALKKQIREAVAEATARSYLRPNSVDTLTGKNPGNNLGDDFPYFHFEEWEEDYLKVDLMLKGGGCENVGAQYSLPDARLDANRDLEGVRRTVLDAVQQAQGMGCAPRRDRRGGRRRPGVKLHQVQGAVLPSPGRREPRSEISGTGEAVDHRGQHAWHRPDGIRRQNHGALREDRLAGAPARELFRHRFVYVLGRSAADVGVPEW